MRYRLATLVITILATTGCNGDELKNENARLGQEVTKVTVERDTALARAARAEEESKLLWVFAGKVRDISLVVTLTCTRSDQSIAPPATPLLNTVTLRGPNRQFNLSSSISSPPQVVDNGAGLVRVTLHYLPSTGLQDVKSVEDLSEFTTLEARFQPLLSGIGLNVVKIDRIEMKLNELVVLSADDVDAPRDGGSGNLIFEMAPHFSGASATYREAIKSWAGRERS
jgi:hypothetical protein